MSAQTDLDRAIAFQARVHDSVAEEVRAWELGQAGLSPSLPRVWDANHCRLEWGVRCAAADVATAATAVALDAGLACAAVVARAEDAEHFGPELVELGWERGRNVVMALRSRPSAPSVDVATVRLADVAVSRAETTLEFWPGQDELVTQLARLDKRLASVVGERWFAVVETGEVVSRAWLLVAEGVGQVEDVATTPARRNRGYAKAVVSAAAIASMDAGDDLTFIVADADDTAAEIYRKIGFEPIGVTERYVLPLSAAT